MYIEQKFENDVELTRTLMDELEVDDPDEPNTTVLLERTSPINEFIVSPILSGSLNECIQALLAKTLENGSNDNFTFAPLSEFTEKATPHSFLN